jgi:hypothetical protein
LKILHAGKVFFHFFEIFLNGQIRAIVMPQPPFSSFYRIAPALPRKKLKFFWPLFCCISSTGSARTCPRPIAAATWTRPTASFETRSRDGGIASPKKRQPA